MLVMSSPQNTTSFTTFRIVRRALQLSSNANRIFNSTASVRPILVVVTAVMLSHSVRGDIPITAYLAPEPAGQCVYACQCDGNFDGVIWDQVEVDVGRGFAAGLYGV